jgi:hypothetical protein
MSKFEKFMVVPYKLKQEEPQSKNSKISEILNNYSLNNSDKTKLIDQLLIQNNNQDKDIEVPNIQKENLNIDFNSILKTKKRKDKDPYYRDIDSINRKLNKINGTKNNAQLFLNPAASTRNQTKKIKDKINISINQIKKLNKSINKLNQAPSIKRTVKKTSRADKKLNETLKDDKISENDDLNDSGEFQSFNQTQANTSKVFDWDSL